MDNMQIAKAFFEIANLLEIQGVSFKPQAYRNVARYIELMPEDLAFLYHTEGEDAIRNIPGVGEHIFEKIIILIETGKLPYLEELRKQIPIDMSELSRIEGVGPKTIKKLHELFGVRNLSDLERVVKEGKLQGLRGFKEKHIQNILQGIEFFKTQPGRIPYNKAFSIALNIMNQLKKHPSCKKIEIAGSLRRKKSSIGDIDLLALSDAPEELMGAFSQLPFVLYIYGKGGTKASVKLKNGMNVDLRIVPEESWGAALQYFTGDKSHNVALRIIAIKQGYKLNEYGLFQGEEQIAGKSEEEIYYSLGFQWIPPEERLNEGEFEKYHI